MHTDEAVQASIAVVSSETGHYHYNPKEFHGPALPYLSDAVRRLRGIYLLKDADEAALRMISALFGIGTIFLSSFSQMR